MSSGQHRARQLVPDLDEEMVSVLAQVEQVLLTLSTWESDPDDPAVQPVPLAGRHALDALNRVQTLIAPAQTRLGRVAGASIPVTVGPARLLSPHGRYEHRPLSLVALDHTDLDLLSAAAGALGRVLAVSRTGSWPRP